LNMPSSNRDFGNWRDYQRDLSRKARRRYLFGSLPVLGLWSGTGAVIVIILFYSVSWLSAHFEERPRRPPKEPAKEAPQLTKADLAPILAHLDMDLLKSSAVQHLEHEGATLTVETSIIPALQQYASKLLGRSKTHAAAAVILRPETGEILAMAQAGEGDRKENLCLKADLPAASLFKIVAAAAAIEARGMSPQTELTFQGGKYTLYRSQLKPQNSGRYTVRTTLRDAFADSINPVFGKLGIYELGREVMEEYAQRFLFDCPIPFDLPLEVSHFDPPEEEFAMAEIASGFNKRTLISPLHAALITAAVSNEGVIMAPWVVKRVRSGDGRTLYEAEPNVLARPVHESTVASLRDLMSETANQGTARNAFRPLQRKNTFRDFDFGAKTGSINDPSNQYRLDWMAAYALPAGGRSGLSVAVLAVHGEKMGIRARDIVRQLIEEYFRT
jgi:penicillin-binding protein A